MYWSSETSKCQHKTGWEFFLWYFLLFWLTDTARITSLLRDPATLLPRLTPITTICGLGTVAETLTSTCKACHVWCNRATHFSCTVRVLTVCSFLSLPLLSTSSTCLPCFHLSSVTDCLLGYLAAISFNSYTDSLPFTPLPSLSKLLQHS